MIEHGGFTYDSNAYNDDIPYVLKKNDQKLVIIPYSFDTNDMRYDGNNGFVHGDDFNIYCKESFNQLLSETDDGSLRMMSIGLHPRIIGRPGRIKGLEDFIKYIKTYENVWIPKRMDIAKYCLEKDSFNFF